MSAYPGYVPMTDEELHEIWIGAKVFGSKYALFSGGNRAIEQAVLARLPKPIGEPIVWHCTTKYGSGVSYSDKFWELHPNFYNGLPEPRPTAERDAKIAEYQQMIAELVNALTMVLDDPDALDGRPRTAEVVHEALAKAKAKGGAA